MSIPWPTALQDHRFTSRQVCRAAQIGTTTLSLWVSRGHVKPLTTGGPGVQREFSFEAIYKTALAANLSRQGLPIGDAYNVINIPPIYSDSLTNYFVVDPSPPDLPDWPIGGRYVSGASNIDEFFGYGPTLIPTTARGAPAIHARDLKGPRKLSVLIIDVSAIIARIVEVAER